MSYRLKKKKNVAEDVRRVVLEQVDTALEMVERKKGNKDDSIHDARVCFKKIRAILRLMRGQLGDAFQQENVFYRDLGRRLSAVRNKAAMLEAFAKLRGRYGDQLTPHALSGQRRPLAASNTAQTREKSEALAEVARSVRNARRRIAKWPLGDDGFGGLARGLKRTYKQGRGTFAIACEDPTVENLHEWRKRVKDLWYQIRLLKKIWPAEMGQLADEMKRLGDYLSDHHDLAMLRQAAAEHAKEVKDEGPEVETLLALIDQRRAELRLEAKLLGDRLYAEKPGAFVHRLGAYWQAWQAEPKSKPAAAHSDGPSVAA